MSTYSDNLWAEAHGIDLDELQREHPLHPDQLRLKRIITRKAEAYWARERFLARLEYSSKAISEDTPEPAPVKIRKKRANVSRYEFTDAQLEIAFRSLDARGAV
jgi:hypothetical protein